MDTNIYTPNSIRTFTGKVFDLKILNPDSICIEDIAHGLAHTARFGGQLEKTYTVAQHSVMCARAVPAKFKKAALLHDASEAYLGDMPSPFKSIMPDFKQHENRVMAVIAEKFQFSWPLPENIKEVDQQMLVEEWRTFVEKRIEPGDMILEYWPADLAEAEFLNIWHKVLNYDRHGIYI